MYLATLFPELLAFTFISSELSQDILASMCVDEQAFVLWLHQNYPSFMDDMDSCANAVEWLSLANHLASFGEGYVCVSKLKSNLNPLKLISPNSVSLDEIRVRESSGGPRNDAL